MISIHENLIFEDERLPVRCWIINDCQHSVPFYSHWHGLTEIVYNRRGNAIQQLNSNFFVMRQGDMSVICADQLHSYFAYSEHENMEIYVLQFDAAKILGGYDDGDAFKNDWASGRLFFPDAIHADAATVTLLHDIYSEFQTKCAGYIQAVTGSVMKLMVRLYRLGPSYISTRAAAAAFQSERKSLSPTFDFIAEHFNDESLSLDAVAAHANFSVAHFCRLFRRMTGMSFNEYLNRLRVSYAHQLLLEGKSVSETAYICGYGSSSALYRNFKKISEVSPCQFKNQSRAGQ